MHKKLLLLGLLGLMFSQGFTVQDDTVVRIRAYALKKGDSSSSSGSSNGEQGWGHAWISIENTTDDVVLKVSGYPLMPHEGITTSAWFNKEPHKGAWFNIEHLYPSDKHIATKFLSLNKKQVGEISSYIDSHNKWDIWNTCANYTSNIWNLFTKGDEQIKSGWIGTPDALYKSISEKKEHYIGVSYPSNPNMGYISDRGTFIRKVPDTFMGMEPVTV